MNPEIAEDILRELRALRDEVKHLSERVTRLEAETHEIDPETLIALSAAVAAFLGKRAHLRQVRLLGSGGWVQEGRRRMQDVHLPRR